MKIKTGISSFIILSVETYDANPEFTPKQATDLKNLCKPQFRKYFNFCHESNHSVSTCFRKQREDEERKRLFYYGLKTPVKSLNQYFAVYQNQTSE